MDAELGCELIIYILYSMDDTMVTKRIVKKPIAKKPIARKPVKTMRCHKIMKRMAKHPSLRMKIKLNVAGMLRGKNPLDYYSTGTYDLKNGGKIKIEWEEEAGESPREWDNLGTFITWDRRYNSPDKNPYRSPEEFFEEYNDKNAIIYYVDKYEHSGVNYSLTSTPKTRDRWDSAIVGVMFVPKDKVRKYYGNITQNVKDKVHQILEGELDTYNKWANGEVFYYVLYDKDGNEKDSCGGFYSVGDAFDGAGINKSDLA